MSDAMLHCGCGAPVFVPWGAVIKGGVVRCEACKMPSAVPLEDAKPREGYERKTCPRCGGAWYPWAGSKLATHARCHFAVDEQERLFDQYMADPKLTVAKFAVQLGVTTGVVQALIYYTKKRRGMAPGNW